MFCLGLRTWTLPLSTGSPMTGQGTETSREDDRAHRGRGPEEEEEGEKNLTDTAAPTKHPAWCLPQGSHSANVGHFYCHRPCGHSHCPVTWWVRAESHRAAHHASLPSEIPSALLPPRLPPSGSFVGGTVVPKELVQVPTPAARAWGSIRRRGFADVTS